MAVFACVVEHDSLTRAADMLGLSKSFVSKTLRALEERLATRLLQRTTRRQSLTEAGRAYYDGCRSVLDAATRGREAVDRLQREPIGVLRMSVPVNFGNLYVAPLLPTLLQAHPNLRIELVLSDDVVDLVREQFDFAMRIVDRIDEQLIARPLATIRWVVCASPRYFLDRGKPTRPQQLESHDCLTHRLLSPAGQWPFEVDRQPLQVRVGGPMHTNNSLALMNAALGGLGIARLPTYLAGPALLDGRLHSVLEEFAAPPQTASAVFAAGGQLSPKVRRVVDFLRDAFGGAETPPCWDTWRQASGSVAGAAHAT